MFQFAEVECPALTELRDRLQAVGEFTSVFFRPEGHAASYPDFSRGDQCILMEVLHSNFLDAAVPRLAPIDVKAALTFAKMDRFELEGSLVSVLLQGTCTEPVVASETEARETARAILASFLSPRGSLHAFRMDDPNWSPYKPCHARVELLRI